MADLSQTAGRAAEPQRWRPAVVTVNDHGQGVLVTGGLVLTAAHCISCDSIAGVALGDPLFAAVTTHAGERFRMMVLFLDPVSDLAVLGPADGHGTSADEAAFDRFADATEGVPVHPGGLRPGSPTPARVYAHTGELLAATVTKLDPGHRTVVVVTEVGIRCGTSGGPIVSADGRLVAVVSQAGGECGADDDEIAGTDGVHPLPARALPVWAVEQVTRGNARSAGAGKTTARRTRKKG